MKKEFKNIALVGTVIANLGVGVAQAKEVNCKGVATKWVNDCQANGHDCASKADSNFNKDEWLKMDKADCEVVQNALKNKALKNYVAKIQKGTIVATKRGKKF